MDESISREEMQHSIVKMLYESTAMLSRYEKERDKQGQYIDTSISEQIRSNCETLANAVNAMYL